MKITSCVVYFFNEESLALFASTISVKFKVVLFSVFVGGLVLFFSTISVFFIFFTGGAPCLNFISAVKTVKIEKFCFFTVSTGGVPLFLYHICGKNGKNRELYFALPFLPGGAPFSSIFFYHIHGKNGKNRKFPFFTFFPAGSRKDTP